MSKNMALDEDHKLADPEKGLDNKAFNVESSDHIDQEPEPNAGSLKDEEFEDLPLQEPNVLEKILDKTTGLLGKAMASKYKRHLKIFVCIALAILYNIYFFGAIHFYLNSDENQDFEWCDGIGLLVVATVIVYAFLVYFNIVKPLAKKILATKTSQDTTEKYVKPMLEKWDQCIDYKHSTTIISSIVIAIVLVFLLIDTVDDRNRLVSFFGIFVLVILAVLMSQHPSQIRWRHVMWGLGLQYIFGLVILRSPGGRQVFECFGDLATTFLSFTDDGSSFVYGYLSSQQPFNTWALDPNSTAYEVAKEINDKKAIASILAFKILTVIFFVNFIVGMLYHMGAMQWAIQKIGWLLQLTIGTTACESLTASANIFVGSVEAPLMIRHYIPRMTNSELHAIMVSGLSTIAGSVLAAYISFGAPATHLLTASVMSAPASLAVAKVLVPETKKSKTRAEDVKNTIQMKEANLIDAASQGAIGAVIIVANILGILIAYIAFTGFINGVLGWACKLVGAEGITFQYLLGKLFIPLAWLMGVDADDLEHVGRLIGIKTFINEFVAYGELGQIKHLISKRSKAIVTYALCGFSHPAAVGIEIGCFTTLAPTRRVDLSRLALRAYIGGSLACFLTACVAGSLLQVYE